MALKVGQVAHLRYSYTPCDFHQSRPPMSKNPRAPSAASSPTREERLAKALRENLARRKDLQRAQLAREGRDPAPKRHSAPDRKDETPS